MLQHKQTNFEIKEVSNSGELAGYASVFGVKDSHGDIVVPGAYERTLEEHKAAGTMPKFLFQHDSTNIIGEYLKLREDAYGLYFEALMYKDEPAIPDAARAYALAKRKQLTGMSIGYSVHEDGEYFDMEEKAFILTSLHLAEISIVTFPSNPESHLETIKNAIRKGDTPSPKAFEKGLKALGLSNTQAKRIMSEGFKAFNRDYELESELESLLSKFSK